MNSLLKNSKTKNILINVLLNDKISLIMLNEYELIYNTIIFRILS